MLKKFLFMMVAAIGVMTATAQETVIVKPAALDNTYVSATVGVNTQAASFCEQLYPELNVYVGKWLNPSFGVELNGEMDLWDSFRTPRFFNTVKQSYVGVAGMMNVANAFCGYANRKVDVIPFVGIGWLHGYVNGHHSSVMMGVPSGDTNNIATKMGVNVQINLNEKFALNVRPTIMWNLTENRNNIEFNANHSLVGLELGATYNFGGKFAQKQVVDYAEFAALNEEVNALRARQPETVTVTNVVEKVVTNTQTKFVSQPVNVGFTLNSSEISYTQLAAIRAAADCMLADSNITAVVKGYADAATGTPEYNMGLSERRAQAVKNTLVNMGVAANRIQVCPEGSCTQVYSENDWNRAAVIELR